MDMRNVAHLASIMVFSSNSVDGFNCIKEAALYVFGDTESVEDHMRKVTDVVSTMPEEDLIELMQQSAIGCFALLKADLEADALRDKENAS